MKKSRLGVSLIFVIVLMVIFAILVFSLSHFVENEERPSGIPDILDYGNKIGVIPIEGTIMTSDETLKDLRKFRKKSSIRAIVLRINSPGGTVAPAQEIYREIEKIRKKKPIVASIETVGASAAYYIASSTDSIVCSKGSITGSIGVIMMLPDLHKVIEKIGVNVNVIKAGAFKDIGSGVKPLNDQERDILQNFATEIHEQFILDVLNGRQGKIELDKLRSIADGRFFTGQTAKELGLVDSMGNFYDAVKVAGNLGGIKGEPELEYPKKKWNSYLDLFLDTASKSLVKGLEYAGTVQDKAPVPR
ncbi:MAG: signal peptide peptidase SppA [Deltaproteobacteria bacterium]|nr:signal peptide peptidase SppA [Deltaproteobacteria bacterium]